MRLTFHSALCTVASASEESMPTTDVRRDEVWKEILTPAVGPPRRRVVYAAVLAPDTPALQAEEGAATAQEGRAYVVRLLSGCPAVVGGSER